MGSNSEWITTDEAAEMAGVHKATVIRWIRAGQVRASRIVSGSPYRINREYWMRLVSSGVPRAEGVKE